MRLTPLDIRKQEFTRAFRGYEAEEVQAFMHMVSNQWEEMLDDQRRLEERLREMEAKLEHYERVEEALQEALQTARDSSRKTLENAERKAQLVLEDAEARAREIKQGAEQERQQLKRETAHLNNRRGEIVARLRAFLMSEMELLARFEGEDPVGFIKLLPSDEARGERMQRLQRSAQAEEEGWDLDAERPAGRPEMPARPEAPAYRKAVSRPDAAPEAREAAAPATGAPASGVAEADASEADVPEAAEEEAAAPRPEARPGAQSREGVRSGPGWTARTVVSTPAGGRGGEAPRRPTPLEDDAEGVAATSEEIEKIRRILNDLD